MLKDTQINPNDEYNYGDRRVFVNCTAKKSVYVPGYGTVTYPRKLDKVPEYKKKNWQQRGYYRLYIVTKKFAQTHRSRPDICYIEKGKIYSAHRYGVVNV